MSMAALIGFLLLAGVAAYAQTLTGFAFGLITMGGVGLTGLLSLPDAAMLVSVLTLVNATQMLLKGWRDVDWRKFGLVMLSSLPFLFIGFQLLGWLADSRADWLRLALGCTIIISSLQLARKPQPLTRPSGPLSYLFFGSIAGLMGGMFSTSGPPVVYHLYRQPLPHIVVRETLVTIFAVNAVFRTGLVAATGQIPSPSTLSGLLAVPVVMAATHLARRYPPRLTQRALRQIVFVLLFLSGVSLGAPAVVRLLGF
ncbi:putative membrane transporter protein [Hyphomicrobiales bacterium]|nr:putative membrane transporter protein [Hyphomicrobiales bacterium]CAH1697170.1 putative membrane transporter protein [Hyphomicrobiales bacterium]CAI0342738.1 putative membrane transporter protein [Hyphomicrobiales bacterium]